jgi:hypothetical protein
MVSSYDPRETPMSKTHQQEVDENYLEFVKLLPNIVGTHANKFALMKEKQIRGYFSTAEDASSAASNFITDGIYSIQQVTTSVIDLGFFSHAIPIN